MTWPPETWAVGEDLTSTIFNERVRDPFLDVWRELLADQAVAAGAANLAELFNGGAVSYSGRPLRFEYSTPSLSDTSGVGTSVTLHDGAGASLGTLLSYLGTSGALGGTGILRIDPSAGVHTWRLVFNRGGGGSGGVAAGKLTIWEKGGP